MVARKGAVGRKSIVAKGTVKLGIKTYHGLTECTTHRYRGRGSCNPLEEVERAQALVILGGKPGRQSHFACCWCT